MRLFLFFPIALGLAGGAAAQTDPDILVRGQLPAKESREQARSYVRATGIARGVTPAARWSAPVCPKVLGISPKLAARVEGRIRALAEASGAKTAAAGCESNVVVSFVTDAPAVARNMREKKPRLFIEQDAALRDAFTTSAAPVRWWYSTGVKGRDGTAAGTDPPPSTGGGEGGISPLNVGGGVIRPPGPSLISTQVMRSIEAVAVLVDVDRATGKRLDDVADYAAFVSLAEMYPADPPPDGSVLGLFSGDGGGLRDSDRRLLAALYRIPLDRQARRHRGMLAIAVDPASKQSIHDEGIDEAE